MQKPKVEKVNLPYASTVASFYGDQGAMQGNSFLGKMWNGGGRNVVMNKAAAAAAPRPAPVPVTKFVNGNR